MVVSKAVSLILPFSFILAAAASLALRKTMLSYCFVVVDSLKSNASEKEGRKMTTAWCSWWWGGWIGWWKKTLLDYCRTIPLYLASWRKEESSLRRFDSADGSDYAGVAGCFCGLYFLAWLFGAAEKAAVAWCGSRLSCGGGSGWRIPFSLGWLCGQRGVAAILLVVGGGVCWRQHAHFIQTAALRSFWLAKTLWWLWLWWRGWPAAGVSQCLCPYEKGVTTPGLSQLSSGS